MNSNGASLEKAHGLARRRVLVSAAAGLTVAIMARTFMASWQATHFLIGWDTAAIVFLLWIGSAIWGKDSAETMQLALREDNSRAAADVVLLAASIGSLVAVVLTLLERPVRPWHSALVVASVVLSWLAVHAVFTLRYARLYYAEPQGGVDFNEKILPRYTDFAYLAFTIGMTYQVSDTNLTSKIRTTALHHALLSFLFGTVIIATVINAMVGLLK